MPMKMFWGSMESPIGKILVGATDKGLCKLDFGFKGEEEFLLWIDKKFCGYHIVRDDNYMEKYILQLSEYFRGKRREFDLSLDLLGTEFQVKVWKQLMNVKYGTTATYKDIAIMINSPKAVRAVGGANNKNPIPIILPCHRIIGSNGSLVGYGGGLDIKRTLLKLEGVL